MRSNSILTCVVPLALALACLPGRATLQQDYLEGYLDLHQAELAGEKNNSVEALKDYQACYDKLLKIRAVNPDWEKALIESQIQSCRMHIAALQGTPVPVPPVKGAAPQAPIAANRAPTPQQQYLSIYLKLNDAEVAERSGHFADSLAQFQDCMSELEKLHDEHPYFEPVLVSSRMEDSRAKLAELAPKVDAMTANTNAPSITSLPSVPPSPRAATYPWKTNIITTVFWIGSHADPVDVWNPIWVERNGGPAGWENMSGYASSNHASSMNPFYVALPFNDLAHPEKARQWVPASWAKPPREGKPVSACQDRWVEIKGPAGRICFAQWEDVGPERSDNAEYVFGSGRPNTSNRSGLDVSPAVAKYLGIELPGGSAWASWRFVDNPDVQPGMWLKYDEQAILFRALEQQNLNHVATESH